MRIECKNIQEQIPYLIAGTLSQQESKNVQSHIETCPVCREYKEAMQRDDQLLIDYADSMRPRIARMERDVKTAIEATPIRRQPQLSDLLFHFIESKLTRLAAAAVLLIAISFLAGLVWGSQHKSEQIRAFLKASLKQDLQSAVASMKGELRDEYQQQLNRYAIQTLTASNAVTNQLLSQLVEAINQSRSQELGGIVTAMGQIEANRLRENNELRQDLATFASYTDERLSQTQKKMTELWDYTRPGDNQENSNNNF